MASGGGAAPEIQTRTIDLSDGAVGPTEGVTILDPVFQPIPLASLDRLALVGTRSTTEQQSAVQELYIVWRGTSWGTPEPIATAPDIPSFALDSDEQGNIIVVWRDTDEIWSRIYERARDAWTAAQFVGTTSTDGIVLTPDITAGNAIVAVNDRTPTGGMWAAVYQSGVGWLQSAITRLDDRELYSIGLSIDPAGNALAAWGPELRYRRYIAGVGWPAASALDANVDAGVISSAGAPDGSVLVVATDLEANPNGSPLAVRFE